MILFPLRDSTSPVQRSRYPVPAAEEIVWYGGEGGIRTRSWVKLTSPSPIGGGFLLMFLSLLVYSDCISSFKESRWAYVPC